MPFIQSRAIALVKAGHFYANLVIDHRRQINLIFSEVEKGLALLDAALTREQKEATQFVGLSIIIKSLANIATQIHSDELEHYRVLIAESEHFKKFFRHNNSQREYMGRKRAQARDNESGEILPTLHQPIKTMPRNAPEEKRQLQEMQRKLFSIDKESWTPSEIIDYIAATLPKRSPTAILNDLVDIKFVFHNKTTNKYIVEQPETTEQESSQ